MAGLFGGNFDDPKTQGLLQLGLAMMQGSGPSPVRRPLASIIGEAGQSGIGAYQKARKLQQEEEDRKRAVQLQKLQLQQLMDAIKQREIMRQAGAEAYQSPLGEANEAAFAKTGLPLGRIENAAPQAEVMKTATGGFNPDLFLKSILSKGGDPLAAAQAAQAFRKAKPPPLVLKEGEKALDPVTFKMLADNPKFREQWERIGTNDRGQIIIRERTTGEEKAVGSGPVIGSISVGSQEQPLLKKLGEGVGGLMTKDIEEARQGEETLAAVGQLRAIAQQGRGVSAGPFAQWQTFMLGAANQAGIKLDTERLARDQNYRAEATKLVLDNIGSLARATEKEGEMVKESLIDPNKFNAESLELRFQVMERRARRQIEKGSRSQSLIERQFPGQFPVMTSGEARGGGIPSPVINPAEVLKPIAEPEVIDFSSLPRTR